MQQLDKWQRELEKLTQKEFKKTDSKLFNVYRQSLIDIKKKLYNYTQAYPQLSFSSRLEVERLFHVAEEITTVLTATSTSVEDSIKGFSTNQAEQGYYGVWYALEQSQKITLGMPLINHELVQQMVNKSVDGKRLSSRLYDHRNELANNVTNNIIEGLFNGDSYAKIAKRVSDQTEASYRQALRIAITESGRTNSEASQLSSERAQSLGIDMEKRWLSTLDGKTRADHRALDGQQVPIDGEFKVNGHSAKQPRMFGVAKEDIHCRCTSINIVNGIAPELRKDNETGEMVEYKNYNEWLKDKEKERNPNKENNSPDSVNNRLSFLQKQMVKLEDGDWGSLTEEQAEKLYELYEAEYASLTEKLGKMKYNESEKSTYIYNDGDPLDFFKSSSNYDEWKSKLTEADKDVILSYTGNGYRNINEILRNGEEAYLENPLYKGTPLEYKQKMVRYSKEMEKIIESFEVKEDFITYRTITGSFGDLNELDDIEIFDDGFMSTSVDKSVAEAFKNGDSNVFFSIRVKKGSKVGAYLDELSDYSGEKEFLIKPKTKFKVLGKREEKDDNSLSQYLELEVIE